MIQFCHPGSIMEGTEDLSIRLGDRLASTEKEAATSGAVLLQRPAVGTVIGVLGQGAGHQRSKQEYSHSVICSFMQSQLQIWCIYTRHIIKLLIKDFSVQTTQLLLSLGPVPIRLLFKAQDYKSKKLRLPKPTLA